MTDDAIDLESTNAVPYPHIEEADRCVVALDDAGDGVILWNQNGGPIEWYMHEVTTVPGEIFSSTTWPGHAGVFVFECEAQDCPYEDLIEGNFRDPTEAEWEEIKKGNLPWAFRPEPARWVDLDAAG